MVTSPDVLLSAVTTTTTSQPIRVDGVEALSLELIAALVTSGNGVFKVEISNAETPASANWVQYNMLISNVVNAIAEGIVRVATVTLAATSAGFAFFDPHFHARWMRVTVTVTTDGTYSAILHRRNKSGE